MRIFKYFKLESYSSKRFFLQWIIGSRNNLVRLIIASLLILQTGCKKFIEVNAPVTSTNAANVYTNDATAAAVLTSIYAQESNKNIGFSAGNGLNNISFYAALSSDELTLYAIGDSKFFPYYKNDLSSSTISSGNFWPNIYSIVFTTNSVIEGLNSSTGLTLAVKQQLLGEAKFMRAYCYFYLYLLYGDIPLAISSDYKINSTLSRSSKAQVFQLIIGDLKDAQNLLSANFLKSDALSPYLSGSAERVRPTKWVAAALLAKAYLFNEEYVNAEAQATTVINNSSMFSLTSLNNVFLKNSAEAIWQLQPVGIGTQANTGDGATFILPSTGPNTSPNLVYLSDNIVNSFEPGDQRKNNWTNNVTIGTTTYYYVYKYKIGLVNAPTSEYIMMMRLGEQYLIRAESRAQQNNISGAQSDLNAIRSRAGLPNTTATTQSALLGAILHERQVELFTEWGHRWFDLKRTHTIDATMNAVAPLKGGTWDANKALYPIPQSEISLNPQLTQNAGY